MNTKSLVRRICTTRMDLERIQQRKKDLRNRISTSLELLTNDEIMRQSSIITSKALTLPEYQNAQSISVFLAMPGKEVSTHQIVMQAFKDGKKVYVPYIHASKHEKKLKVMDMLRLRDEDDLNSLKPDAWGIPSLSRDSIGSRENALGGMGCLEDTADGSRGVSTLDLIFMPSVAFDASLNRLGHGRGFYDRYLSLYQSLSTSNGRKIPQLVGLALKQQMLSTGDEIPTNEHDWKVDRVVTPID